MALALPLNAAEPALRSFNVRGLQIGGTTTLVIDGDDFGKNPRLLLPFAAKQLLKPGSTDKQATFDVTLADDVAPGYHQMRVVTDDGVSLPVVIGVDRLPQRAFTASIEQLPAALHGVVSGSQTVETKIIGKAGQKVLVEVEAQRLGSKLRPIIHLTSPKRLQLAWAWASPSLFGDARLEAMLTDDGEHTISVHDAEYAGQAPGFFRLRVGQWSYVDQVFPPVIGKGQTPSVELLGSPGTPTANAAAAPVAGVAPLAWPKAGLWSGPRPFVLVSSHAEVLEQSAAGQLQELPAGTFAVSGRLLTAFEEDRYRVAVKPGTKVRFEVFAERYSSPLDAALVVRNEKGDALARGEDSPNSLDPVLEYTVPANVTAVVVGVLDAQGRGGPRGVYRLTIDPQDATAARKDFKVTTNAQRVVLPVGGRIVVPVLIERRGYAGKIDLVAAGLPPGIKVDGATIPEGADGTLMTVERGDAPFAASVTMWRGRGADGNEQPVLIKGHPLDRLQPWLATEIAFAPSTTKAADFQIAFGNLPSDAAMVPGNKLSLPITVTRANPKTIVKLTLLTSQQPPLVNNQPDPNKTIRQEKPVEVGDKALSGEVTVLVPVELPAPVYDIAVQAELLTPDKKIVLASATTPVRRLPVRLPLVVSVDGAPRIDVALDAKKGAMLKIAGKIERREGLKGDVVVTLAGLPPGAKADAVTVKADATVFALNVVLPPNVSAGEIKGLKLGASAAPDPKQPAQRVKSREVEVTLVVKSATK